MTSSTNPTIGDLQPINPNPGNEKNPANFVGRRDITDRATTMLAAGQNILLDDPRRMGKSFWMVAFAAETNNAGVWRVVVIDYQGVSSVEEFLRMTMEHLSKSKGIPSRFIKYLSALFDNVDSVKVGPVTLKPAVRDSGTSAVELLEHLIGQLDRDIEDEHAVRLVIAMDEVSDAVLTIARQAPDEAANLLQRLRRLRQVATHIRWIVAGSVGFHHVLRQCGAGGDVLNDLNDLPFGPLDAPDTATLTRRLALGIRREIDDDAVTTMYELTGGIPYLVQKLADMMRYDARQRKATNAITGSEVTARFGDFLADRDQGRDVAPFVSRIPRYYGEDTSLAFAILDWVTAGPIEGRPMADLRTAFGTHETFPAVLGNLIDDHYVVIVSAGSGQAVAWRYGAIRAIYVARQATRG